MMVWSLIYISAVLQNILNNFLVYYFFFSSFVFLAIPEESCKLFFNLNEAQHYTYGQWYFNIDLSMSITDSCITDKAGIIN